jgi:hypothetical protein
MADKDPSIKMTKGNGIDDRGICGARDYVLGETGFMDRLYSSGERRRKDVD